MYKYTQISADRERKDCQRIIRPSSSSSPIERYIEQHRRFTVIFYQPWRPLNVKARWKSGGRQDLYPRGESNALLPGDIYSGLWRNLFTASLRRSKVLFRKFSNRTCICKHMRLQKNFPTEKSGLDTVMSSPVLRTIIFTRRTFICRQKRATKLCVSSRTKSERGGTIRFNGATGSSF